MFQELVPSGSGQMIIKTSADVAAAPRKDGEDSSDSGSESDGEDDDHAEEEEEFDEEGQVGV